ncbi:MAG: AbrB/MazE/SpoVT family DNA-binding domain-containing protein [Candidatus Micrarchaeota archaeon]|nr:AbrB/MazE/SpoVT family DNA-binding domain-containing protein [Candidatus Micrarchaeota archaeon]
MELERIVGPKGQVVIPIDVRKKAGIKPGSDVVFEVIDSKIIIKKKMSPKEFVDDFGNVPKKVKGLNAKKIKAILEEEYDA